MSSRIHASPALSNQATPLADDEVLVVVSIDTEEDNWVPARKDLRTENTRELPRLHKFLTGLGARPTYFVTYALATDPTAARIVRELSESEGTEVGTHLHPWNTPPLDEEFVLRNTMLANLPAPLQRAKLERVTAALSECLGGKQPRSFRAGRWALGAETIAVLLDGGYVIDSSVTPYTRWVDHGDGPSYIGAPIDVYRLDPGADVITPVAGGPLVEVPVSFGFNRAPLTLWSRVHSVLTSRVGHALGLDRIAGGTGLLRWVTLSPETDDVDDMMALTKALLAGGVRHLHMYVHSPSLVPGLTPFVKNSTDLSQLYAVIEEYLQRLSGLVRLRFATVAEAAHLLQPQSVPKASGE